MCNGVRTPYFAYCLLMIYCKMIMTTTQKNVLTAKGSWRDKVSILFNMTSIHS
uniref:Uncharacterized protein n=1 Tax=Anguilla anguilla TaxID=7936 RepID=A0A0E9U874_ANGAN